MGTLIDNVARFPQATMKQVEAAPMVLRDESLDTLRCVAKIWSREGLRARVLVLAEAPGVTREMKIALLRACVTTRRIH